MWLPLIFLLASPSSMAIGNKHDKQIDSSSDCNDLKKLRDGQIRDGQIRMKHAFVAIKTADLERTIASLTDKKTDVKIIGLGDVSWETAVAIQRERLSFLDWLDQADGLTVLQWRAMVERCVGRTTMARKGNRMAGLPALEWFMIACYELTDLALVAQPDW